MYRSRYSKAEKAFIFLEQAKGKDPMGVLILVDDDEEAD
jgi:hypothetical protein